MITHQSICRECENQTEISKNSKSFQVVLKSFALSQHHFNDKFGNEWFASSTKKSTMLPDQVDWINESFCDRDCFIEYLKQHMLDNGMIKITQEELEQMEENQPKEVKEMKRVPSALRDLEQTSNAYMGAHKK